MSATFTSAASVQELDFESIGPLIHCGCLICDFCSSNQRFACGFLRIPLTEDTLAVRLALPLAGCALDFNQPVTAPCRAHQSDTVLPDGRPALALNRNVKSENLHPSTHRAPSRPQRGRIIQPRVAPPRRYPGSSPLKTIPYPNGITSTPFPTTET